MKRDYEIYENNEIYEKFGFFVYFFIFVFFVIPLLFTVDLDVQLTFSARLDFDDVFVFVLWTLTTEDTLFFDARRKITPPNILAPFLAIFFGQSAVALLGHHFDHHRVTRIAQPAGRVLAHFDAVAARNCSLVLTEAE